MQAEHSQATSLLQEARRALRQEQEERMSGAQVPISVSGEVVVSGYACQVDGCANRHPVKYLSVFEKMKFIKFQLNLNRRDIFQHIL